MTPENTLRSTDRLRKLAATTRRFLWPFLIWIGITFHVVIGYLMANYVFLVSPFGKNVLRDISDDPFVLAVEPLLRVIFLWSAFSWVLAPWFRIVEILAIWSVWRNSLLNRSKKFLWSLCIFLSSFVFLSGLSVAAYLSWSWSKKDRMLTVNGLLAFFAFPIYLFIVGDHFPESFEQAIPQLVGAVVALLVPAFLFIRRYMQVLGLETAPSSETSTSQVDAQPPKIEKLEEWDAALDGESISLKQKELDSNR